MSARAQRIAFDREPGGILDLIYVLRVDTRRRILVRLVRGPRTATELASELGRSLSAVRRNLKRLEQLELVGRDEAATSNYRLGPRVRLARRRGEKTLVVEDGRGGRLEMSLHV